MSNFEKYLDILNKGRAENQNPNGKPEKSSPLRNKQARDSDLDFKGKSELPFNFYPLLGKSQTTSMDSQGKRVKGEDMVINALQS